MKIDMIDTAPDLPDLPNFKEGTTQYTYDRNGNMIEETGREFTIAYNHLNLPVQVTGSYNGTATNIFYTYTFDGMKLRRRTVDGDVETLTDYVAPFVFETINYKNDFIMHIALKQLDYICYGLRSRIFVGIFFLSKA